MLAAVAQDLGLVREQVECAHRRYLESLIHLAEQDGVLTDFEARDLALVERLLGIKGAQPQTEPRLREAFRPVEVITAGEQNHVAGKRVCFTGEFQCTFDGVPVSRSDAERLAAEKGMIVVEGVTKKLDLLVAADPNSMSTKAKKARDYGIRIVAEPAFWKMIGVAPD